MRTALASTAIVLMLILSLTISTAESAFTAAVRNPQSTVGTGTAFLQASQAGTIQCSSTPTSGNIPATTTFPCSGRHLPGTVPATGTASNTINLTATGTTTFSSASYDADSCGVVANPNTITASNPLLPRGTVTYQTGAIPRIPGSQSMAFNGADSYAVATTQEAPLQDFSIGVWFRTTATSGGLMSFTNSPGNTTPTSADRHLFLNGTGRVSFGTLGSTRVVTAPAAYNDGNWHFAVAVAESNTGPANKRARLTLYIDGVERATELFRPEVAAQTTAGYWRVGQANALTSDGWTGTGNRFFTGALSNAFVIPAPIMVGHVTTLYNTSNQNTYQTHLTSTLQADNLWAFNDTGLDTYTGPFPNGVSNPCSHVRVTVQTSTPTRCLQPALATPCPTLNSSSTLQTLAAANPTPMTVPTATAPQTITTTVGRNSNYNLAYNPGLHLLIPTTITTTNFTQTFIWAVNETTI